MVGLSCGGTERASASLANHFSGLGYQLSVPASQVVSQEDVIIINAVRRRKSKYMGYGYGYGYGYGEKDGKKNGKKESKRKKL